MTNGKIRKQRKLSYEILGLIGISAFFAAVLFLILSWTAAAIVEIYCFHNDVILSEFEWLEVDRWIFGTSGTLSAVAFSLLFLALFSDRMKYIRTITEVIHALRLGNIDISLPLEGRNELTQLADSINYMSATQRLLQQKERSLAHEKEQFVRTLSHDIRTPLTSIMAYSEYLSSENSIPPEEQKMFLQMIRKKAEQIRDLTALLLEGDKRNPEYFDNAHLLMTQLAAEFEEDLEERFDVHTDLSGCSSFSGTFDVQELRRVFDNLSSNVQKYADPEQPVKLSIALGEDGLCIWQKNSVFEDNGEKDSYKLGINSIRRIVQNYGGRVDVSQDAVSFSIAVILIDF